MELSPLGRGDLMSSISMVIPCYNKEKYIADCINSILKQTQVPDEIIIVDDCSTDGSKSIIDQYAKKNSRIKPVYQTVNQGVSAARNLGIKIATSEYITMVDADDILWNPSKIENEMRIIEKRKNQDYNALVYSLTYLIDEDQVPLQQQIVNRKRLAEGRNLRSGMLAGQYMNQYIPRDYCISREVIMDSGLFDETMNYYEDLDLLIRLSKSCEFVCTLHNGTGYRQMQGGLSDKAIEKHRLTIKKLREKYWPELSGKEKMEYWRKRILLLLGRALRKARKNG